MRLFFKLIIVVFFVSIAFAALPNTKDGFKHTYHRKRPPSSTSALSIVSKSQPVKKDFIIPAKKKRVLGQKTHRTHRTHRTRKLF